MTTIINGRRAYVIGKKSPAPKQFVTNQEVRGREFIDHDGTVYRVIWPAGRLLLSELSERLQQQGSNASE